MGRTKIEYVTHTWNPITGCSPCSEGCENCYARRTARAIGRIGKGGYADGDDPFAVRWHPERLDEPTRYRGRKRILVCSMSDIFHEYIDPAWRAAIWEVMGATRHTYLLLTKRSYRMVRAVCVHERLPILPNLQWGVTVESQEHHFRARDLLYIPAAVRWISAEPLLGPLDLREYLGRHRINWLVVGGETDPGARPMRHEWAEDLCRQALDAEVPFFFKQWGPRNAEPVLLGRYWREIPETMPDFGAQERLF